MPRRVEEITAIYLRERVRRDSWTVSDVRVAGQHIEEGLPNRFAVVGDSEPDEFKQGLTYRFYGSWDKSSEQYGPQFRYKTFVVAQPHGRQGVIRYLQQCRRIGQAIAKKLCDKFGGDAVRILRESPDVASAAVGSSLNEGHASLASEDLQHMHLLENVTIELMDLFDGHYFPKTAVRESIRMWGNKAPEFLTRNPYLSRAFPGVGFQKSDAFYLGLGHDPAKLKRQALCLTHDVVEQSERDGHVWVPLRWATTQLNEKIGGTEVMEGKAIELATRGRILRLRTDVWGETWVADERKAAAEENVAMRIVELLQ